MTSSTQISTLAEMFSPEARSQAIELLKDTLRNMLSEWEACDVAHPANLVRRTGLGKQVMIVDRWCGDYQSPQCPAMIGWRVDPPFDTNRIAHGYVLTGIDSDDTTITGNSAKVVNAIDEAKAAAEQAYIKLQKEYENDIE